MEEKLKNQKKIGNGKKQIKKRIQVNISSLLKKEDRIQIRISSSLKDQLKRKAKKENKTISTYILNLVEKDIYS